VAAGGCVTYPRGENVNIRRRGGEYWEPDNG